MPPPSNHLAEIVANYRRFSIHEARGHSPLYEALAHDVAENERLLTFLFALPAERRQPNLFFAAVRHVAGLPLDGAGLERAVEKHATAIDAMMRTRSTQTNEPGRCAVLLPAMSRLPQPLALLEIGASAGLCLLPDFYGYDYGRQHIDPPETTRAIAPILSCDASPATPLPTSLPRIGWRRGIDLHPLSIWQRDDVAWLETLLWPGQNDRLQRFLAAIATARRFPPMIEKGDLRIDLRAMFDKIPPDMTPVILHSAVLSYIDSAAERHAFAAAVRACGAAWISNEAPGVFPDISAKIRGEIRKDRFLLALNGEPLAWTGPHGQSIDWIAEQH